MLLAPPKLHRSGMSVDGRSRKALSLFGRRDKRNQLSNDRVVWVRLSRRPKREMKRLCHFLQTCRSDGAWEALSVLSVFCSCEFPSVLTNNGALLLSKVQEMARSSIS